MQKNHNFPSIIVSNNLVERCAYIKKQITLPAGPYL